MDLRSTVDIEGEFDDPNGPMEVVRPIRIPRWRLSGAFGQPKRPTRSSPLIEDPMARAYLGFYHLTMALPENGVPQDLDLTVVIACRDGPNGTITLDCPI